MAAACIRLYTCCSTAILYHYVQESQTSTVSDKFIASLVAATSVEFERDIDRVDVPDINFWFDSDTQVGKSYLFVYLVDSFREP